VNEETILERASSLGIGRYAGIRIILWLGANDTGTPTLMANELRLKLPAVSAALGRLLKKETVTLSYDPANRRLRRYALSPKGRELLEKLIQTQTKS